MSTRDIMVVQIFFFMDNRHMNQWIMSFFLNVLLNYHLKSHSLHYCVSCGHLKLLILLSQGTKIGIFKTVEMRFPRKKVIQRIHIMFSSSKFIGSTIKISNVVVCIVLLPLCRGFQAYHIFFLGTIQKLYQFIFMTKKKILGTLEPPIMSYLITIQSCSRLKIREVISNIHYVHT